MVATTTTPPPPPMNGRRETDLKRDLKYVGGPDLGFQPVGLSREPREKKTTWFVYLWDV